MLYLSQMFAEAQSNHEGYSSFLMFLHPVQCHSLKECLVCKCHHHLLQEHQHQTPYRRIKKVTYLHTNFFICFLSFYLFIYLLLIHHLTFSPTTYLPEMWMGHLFKNYLPFLFSFGNAKWSYYVLWNLIHTPFTTLLLMYLLTTT